MRLRGTGLGFEEADPWEVAEEARMLAEPAVAIVSLNASHARAPMGVVASPDGFCERHSRLVVEWLSEVYSCGATPVPVDLRQLLGSPKALVAPMRTPRWTAGVIALPLRAAWGPVARELENLGADFALRLEAADHTAQKALLRMATVRGRPGRRHPATAPSIRLPPTMVARRPARVRATLAQ